jgi:hypothetical protein
LNERIEEFSVVISIAHKHSLHVDPFIDRLDESIIINEVLYITPTRTALVGLLTAKETKSIATNFIL